MNPRSLQLTFFLAAVGCAREPHVSLVINDNTDLLENGAILRIQRTGRDEFVQSENIPVFPAEMTLTSGYKSRLFGC